MSNIGPDAGVRRSSMPGLAVDSSPSRAGGDEDNLALYVTALRRVARPLLIAPPLVMLVVGLLVYLMPRSYVARASFVPQESSSPVSSLSAVAAQFGISGLSGIGGSAASPAFYADLLRSKQLQLDVVRTKYKGTAFEGTLVEYYDIDRADSTEAQLAAIKALDEQTLGVAIDRQTGIVRVTATVKDPALASAIVRRCLDLLSDFNIRRRQTSVTAERDFTTDRAQEALAQLRAAELAFADFQRSNRGYQASPLLSAEAAGLERRVSLAQQVYTTLAQQREMARVEAVRNTPVITVIDAPEGLVEARPRGTVVKAALAGVLTALLIAGLAILREARATRRARALPT